MTGTSEATVREQGGVLRVTLSRPAKLNALNEAMLETLRGAVTRLAEEPGLRVLSIDAEGEYFSAGMDINEMPDFRGVSGPDFRRRYRGRHQLLWDELEAVEKPVVVAHQGPCLGGALEMSLSCDFRIASERAAYGLPEIRLGAIPGSGGVSRLTRLVGPAWARWLALAGQQVDAERALAIGLVHRVVPVAAFAAAREELCAALAELSPAAVAAAKLTIDAVDPFDRGTARQIERLATTELATGEEYWRRLEEFRDRGRGRGEERRDA